MTFSLSIWYALPAPVSSWFSIVTCWKIIKVETMPSSVKMVWPATIILHVPDLLHIIFSLSLSFSCQARSSVFCQCLALHLEKRTGMPWGVGSLLCAPWFGKLESASFQALQYILLFNGPQSHGFFPDALETVTQSSREEFKNCSWTHKVVFVKRLDVLSEDTVSFSAAG